ncbi:organic hydroperoxide resistance protein [Mesorhizobium australicum]|uniref:Peroxiredoxin, Ohr subfamily n=1 Tax=Mesorhizobium australicum TaxID=536018 RepID=A0A1X7MSE6_9HYPH|nr:organic hydroperoxide resistance protein [Mesorhizobium australicum]SMH27759.1 peroxiredoxin, Ohr subfamily [Mesorhizobium australicum]
MLTKTIYTAYAESTGGRTGRSRTNDGLLDLKLDKPVEMGGEHAGTNPEQLFACGYSACFGGTIDAIAKAQKIELSDIVVAAEVDFGPRQGGGFGVGVRLKVQLPGIDRETVEKLVEMAHRNCPYSNATRGNIDVEIEILN